MAGIKEYGPWSESIWEGVDCTVVEIERKEQDNDSNDMDVKENEDDAANQSPRFQRADKFSEFPDGSQLSSSRDEFSFYVKVHEKEWTNILKSIEDHLVKSAPLSEYITNLNFNIANTSMEYVLNRNKDGSYIKSKTKIIVFKITWFIAAFCTGASGVSFCWNGDLVICKLDCEILVNCRDRMFDRGQFDVNVELREVAQQETKDGYYSVNVFFSSQFIPYIYRSAMKVANLQWAGILGSFYILAEICDHFLTGEKDKNSTLHT